MRLENLSVGAAPTVIDRPFGLVTHWLFAYDDAGNATIVGLGWGSCVFEPAMSWPLGTRGMNIGEGSAPWVVDAGLTADLRIGLRKPEVPIVVSRQVGTLLELPWRVPVVFLGRHGARQRDTHHHNDEQQHGRVDPWHLHLRYLTVFRSPETQQVAGLAGAAVCLSQQWAELP